MNEQKNIDRSRKKHFIISNCNQILSNLVGVLKKRQLLPHILFKFRPHGIIKEEIASKNNARISSQQRS